MPVKTSKEIENKIIALSNGSLNKTQVAKAVNVTVKVVERIAKENHLKFAIADNSRTDNKLENKVIKMFNHGYNISFISDELELSVSTIHRILKRNNIKKTSKINLNITIDERKYICDLYEKGFSTVDISEMFKEKVRCDHTISKILKECGVEVGAPGSKAIILNENFFENIDTEQKAYYLGFIYADGNVTVDSRGNHIFQMELQREDVYILEQIRDVLGCKVKLKDFKNKEIYFVPKSIAHIARKGRFKNRKYNKKVSYTRKFQVISKKIFDDLSKYGVKERKTFDLSFPIIPQHLIRHFVRGYFDGDGSFTTSDMLKYIFYGQNEFLNSINKILKKELDVNDVTVFDKKDENVSMLTYGSLKDVMNIFSYLYKDSNYYLIRKRKKALSHIGTEVTL